MKKTIILILALLPIVLLVVIAFAGQILSIYQHIPVEKVEFVDRFNNAYTDEHVFTLNQGSTKATAIRIYPELATNKNVTYKSNDESVCTVDESGVLTGVRYGTTTISVTTEDGNKIAMLNVRVKADVPISVSLSVDELSMIEGELFQLEATVEAPVALDKNVTYESSDPSIVKVDATGKLTAVSEGIATVTVTTVSGGLTDTCIVTVTKGVLPISFDFDGAPGVRVVNGIYEISDPSIDLVAYLRVSDAINIDDVVIKIQSGSSASIKDGVLTFTRENSLVTIRAYVGDENNPTYIYEIKLIFKV